MGNSCTSGSSHTPSQRQPGYDPDFARRFKVQAAADAQRQENLGIPQNQHILDEYFKMFETEEQHLTPAQFEDKIVALFEFPHRHLYSIQLTTTQPQLMQSEPQPQPEQPQQVEELVKAEQDQQLSAEEPPHPEQTQPVQPQLQPRQSPTSLSQWNSPESLVNTSYTSILQLNHSLLHLLLFKELLPMRYDLMKKKNNSRSKLQSPH